MELKDFGKGSPKVRPVNPGSEAASDASADPSANAALARCGSWRRSGRRSLHLMVASAVVMAGIAAPSWADGVGIGAAHGQDADQYGVQVQFDGRAPLKEWPSSALKTYLIVGVGEFQGRKHGVPEQTVRVLGTTGVLRWEHAPVAGLRPFADFGLGVGGLSEKSINGNRDFGGKFEFNEILQVGVRFGPHSQWEFNLRAQHFSNAGTNPPNDGMTYGGAGLTWYWN